MNESRRLVRWVPVLAIAALSVSSAFAQGPFTTRTPGDILSQYHDAMVTWETNIFGYARDLFALLATIELGWTAALLVLEGADLQAWVFRFFRSIMAILAFYTILLYGNQWFPAVISSFAQMGSNAAGIGSISPTKVFVQGLKISGTMMAAASDSGFLLHMGSGLTIILCALIILLCWALVTLSLILTWVESYVSLSVAYIMLGMGGSRWTREYVSRYVGMVISVGLKILTLYCVIAVGVNMSNDWITEAGNVSLLGPPTHPILVAFDVLIGTFIFALLTWNLPRVVATVLGGGPSLGHGDVLAVGFMGAQMGMTAASLVASGGAGAAAGAGGAGAAGGASAAGSSGAGTSVASLVSSVGAASSSVSPPGAASGGSAPGPGGGGSSPGAGSGSGGVGAESSTSEPAGAPENPASEERLRRLRSQIANVKRSEKD
jgi:type IV secretion system protein TrbL